MRYTTLIDITEDRALYRNKAVRLLYLHLVLKAGYHDDDKDICKTSIRCMASDVGLTLSATRYALSKLRDHGFIEQISSSNWRVKKWTPTIKPTPRKQVTVTQQDLIAARDREEKRLEREREMENSRLSYEERIENMRKAYERNPKSMQGQAYSKYLDELKKSK